MIGLFLMLVCMPPAQAAAPEDLPDDLPESWAHVVEEAPVTAQEFQQMDLPALLEEGLRLVKAHLHMPLNLAAKICGLLLITALARSMCQARAAPSMEELLETVSALAVFTLCAPSVLGLLEVMYQTVETSRNYIIAFVPVFASVLISCGQPGGAALYSGFFFGAAMIVSDVLCRLCLPVTRILVALHATASVGCTVDLSRGAAAAGKWMKWLLTLCATIFGALVSLQGVLAQGADTLALKTGKFLIGSGVPVVGRAVSDALGSVMASLQLVKGSVGFAAIAVIAAAFLPVLLQCAACQLVLGAGELVASSTGGAKSARLLAGLADCASLCLSMAFFFCVVIIAATLMMVLLGNGV